MYRPCADMVTRLLLGDYHVETVHVVMDKFILNMYIYVYSESICATSLAYSRVMYTTVGFWKGRGVQIYYNSPPQESYLATTVSRT